MLLEDNEAYAETLGFLRRFLKALMTKFTQPYYDLMSCMVGLSDMWKLLIAARRSCVD